MKNIIAAVDTAIYKYGSDHVDVMRNEETQMLDVMYHNYNNSFAIQPGVADPRRINKRTREKLEAELNARGVCLCW